MADPADYPFELHPTGGGGFVVFATGESVALPLMALGKATLRGEGGCTMTLEFAYQTVVIEGGGLNEVFSHLLAGRVKTIRNGRHTGCTIDSIQIADG